VRFLRFSRKQQDGYAPNFFQGLEENTCFYNLHWKAMHPAFKRRTAEKTHSKM